MKDFKKFTPSYAVADRYWQQWMTFDRSKNVEDALIRLFSTRDKHFLDQSDMLIKCSTLNDFYSTRIFSVYRVVEHYSKVKNLGKRMDDGDISIVEELRNVPINEVGDTRDFYSFATKFCAHHNPEAFPIYDSYVDQMLRELRNRDHKLNFNNNDLKDYAKFRDILCRFRDVYGMPNISFRKLDIMLWLGGKDYFPKKY